MDNEVAITEWKFILNTGLVLSVKSETYEEALRKAIKSLYPHERIIRE